MSQRPQSKALFDRACELMPGGVNSPVRAFRSVGGHPVFFDRGEGGEFVCADGRRFIDFCHSWGPLIHGHAHPDILKAVVDTAARGLTFGAPHRGEITLSEKVLAGFPDFQRVRFLSSGTEAVTTAVRLARGVTGRSKILKFDGCYHGHVDSLLVKAGSGLATLGVGDSAGIPPELAALTIVVPLDDEAALEAAFQAHGNELACAIIEPLPANDGLLMQRDAFLRKLRDLCTKSGAVLIFDEVISGFRIRYGGFGETSGAKPDLVTLGKIVGGGLPVGAIVGTKALMEQLAPLGPVYQAGTLSGNPVAMAAGAACLDLLADGRAYAKLESLGQCLDTKFGEIAARRPGFAWSRKGSIFWLRLGGGEAPRRADAISRDAKGRYSRVYGPLLDRGIYLAPSAFEVGFLCTAHTEEHVGKLAAALDAVLAEAV